MTCILGDLNSFSVEKDNGELILIFYISVQGRRQPKQSQLIQIYSLD